MISREQSPPSSTIDSHSLRTSKITGTTAVLATLLLAAAGIEEAYAQAQLRGPKEQITTTDGQSDTKASLRATSMFIVEAPKPKTYACLLYTSDAADE